MITSKLAPHPDNYVIGKGELYFDRFDSSLNRTGELDLGNASAVGITPSYTTKEHFSSRRGLKNTDQSIDMEKKFSLKFVLEEVSNENMMLALRGPMSNWNNPQYLTQSAGTSTSEPFVARQNRLVKLVFRDIIQGTVTLKNSAGTTMTEGANRNTRNADFWIDYQTGRVFTTYDGRIYDMENCTITYTYGAIKYPQMITSDDTNLIGYMRFIAKNEVGPRYEWEFWSVKVKAASEIKLIGDDYTNISFEGDILDDYVNHPTVPYFQCLEIKQTMIIS